MLCALKLYISGPLFNHKDYDIVNTTRDGNGAETTVLRGGNKMQNTTITETACVPFVDSSTVEDTMDDLRRVQALRALKTIQETSVRNGTSNMTLEEINAEIAAARAERRAR